MPVTAKIPLAGIPPEELPELLGSLPPYRSVQIGKWLSRGVRSFSDMTDLPESLRAELEKRFILRSGSVSARLEDDDGTVKLQISLSDGLRIETVLLTDGEGRRTACLSTQAGCPAGCVFCKTGSLGFRRNLTAAEMVEQFLRLRDIEGDIANIVIMGMGEPLLNLAEVRRALGIFTNPRAFALSARRITLSTCGIIDGIRELTDAGPGIRLALSLTTGDEKLREELMPLGRSNPLALLREALRSHQRKWGQRITLEAVLLGGINTRDADAEAIAAFAEGLDVAVNLIPWNPVEGMTFRGMALREPTGRELRGINAGLERRGIKVTRRFRRGRGISGACGQLGLMEPGAGGSGMDHELSPLVR
ncbi:MAG: 23S rRNA (adenine(2503)-C(2))-methyltransferase RlmN [Spirochaetaceae bacterium]|jgi:23S rRNA (adenine2503-C2)-methyltransferase|nr:23S rRNA (adenine(2503)-C(2))-methyltransferase RlmN [Spirochaetaceae bacterium]